jgi:predicted O-methyltransferase YrrM
VDVLAAVDDITGRTLPPGELAMWKTLRRLAEKHQPRSYLEIGVREGDSLKIVLDAAPVERLALADLWGGTYGGTGRGSHAHVQVMLAERAYAGDVAWLDGDSGTTIPAFAAAKPAPFDMILVDGDHSDAGAGRDLENALRLLAPGGVLVFDDITHPAHAYLSDVAEAFGQRHVDELDKIAEDRAPFGVVAWKRIRA